ncbi:MAG: HAMP domain-containing histidine kinase [Thiobacillaceae bacterium]|nr:HAMP domain-containing histidine kinase [Thiobacillaceae bacterium]
MRLQGGDDRPIYTLAMKSTAPATHTAVRAATAETALAVAQRGNRALALMLLLLHAAFVWGAGEPWGQAVSLAHYGAFLLWQPFLSNVQRLPWSRALVVLAVGVWLAVWPTAWAIALWCIMLAALVGGIALGTSGWRERLPLVLAFIYLLALVVLWLLPRLYGLPQSSARPWGYAHDALVLLPLLVLLLPSPRPRAATLGSDLLHAVLIFLLLGVLVLGGHTAMRVLDIGYVQGMLWSGLILAGALLMFVWLWGPRGGFAGLRNLFSRYVLSLGQPLEDWLAQTAAAAEKEADPEAFIRATMEGFSNLPWATGVAWRTQYSEGRLGKDSPYSERFRHLGVEAVFYTERPLNPTFVLHLRLLTQVVGYFYAAKIREQALATNAYTQAIYETGSRLTHDVKNMLQSLRTLSSAAEHRGPDQAVELQQLMQRQMPQIVKRLEITLDKLKSPQRAAEVGNEGLVLAREWWRDLKARYSQDGIDFHTDDANAEGWLPQDLFDSVADNLLQNALRKRQQDPELHIRVWFTLRGGPQLVVIDDGAAAPPEVVRKLFHAPVSSHDGLGIGLYQAAKQAAQLGYRLTLEENREGRVSFRLYPLPPGEVGSAVGGGKAAV